MWNHPLKQTMLRILEIVVKDLKCSQTILTVQYLTKQFLIYKR